MFLKNGSFADVTPDVKKEKRNIFHCTRKYLKITIMIFQKYYCININFVFSLRFILICKIGKVDHKRTKDDCTTKVAKYIQKVSWLTNW